MLQPGDILEKSDKGHEEARTRKYRVAGKARMLLLIVDGKRSMTELGAEVASLGLTNSALESLLADGFLQVRSVRAHGTAPYSNAAAKAVTDAAATAFMAARKLMNESVFNTLGLRGVFFTQKLEKSSSADDLLGLLPEYEQVMGRAMGEDAAALFVARVRQLLA